MSFKSWHSVPLVLFVILVSFFWVGLSRNPQWLPSSKINHTVPAFVLPSLIKANQSTLTSNDLKGKVSLLNVWASWCPACQEEQIFLMQLAREGMPIFGLNYKDTSKDAKQWLREWGNPYQVIGVDRDGKVAIDLGVYGAPETFLIDKTGVIRYRHAGILDETVWLNDFLPRIKALDAV